MLTGVGKCKEPGGPRGVVSAVVAFESSGKVSTVTISDPPFAGTSTASCLASVLKQAVDATVQGAARHALTTHLGALKAP